MASRGQLAMAAPERRLAVEQQRRLKAGAARAFGNPVATES